MSVINAVLKDLENKPTSFTPLEMAELSIKKPSDHASYYWAGGVLFLLLLLFAAYFQLQQKSNPENRVAVSQVRPESLNSENINALPEKNTKLQTQQEPVKALLENEITGLQINESRDFMELEFQLVKKAKSFLKQRL